MKKWPIRDDFSFGTCVIRCYGTINQLLITPLVARYSVNLTSQHRKSDEIEVGISQYYCPTPPLRSGILKHSISVGVNLVRFWCYHRFYFEVFTCERTLTSLVAKVCNGIIEVINNACDLRVRTRFQCKPHGSIAVFRHQNFTA